MNIPFSPAWLWPLPVLLVVAAWLWQRRLRSRWLVLRERVEVQGTDGLNPREQRLASKAKQPRRVWVGVLVAAWLAVHLLFYSAPSVSGRVVDMATGEPLAGVRLWRHVCQLSLPSIGEGADEEPALFGAAWTRTRKDGGFRLPGFVSLVPVGPFGTCGMNFAAYARGYQPAGRCVINGLLVWPTWQAGCTWPYILGDEQTWARWQWQPSLLGHRTELGLRKVTDAEGWAEALHGTRLLVDAGALPLQEFVEAAVEVSEAGMISEDSALQISVVERRLGGRISSGRYREVDAAIRLLLLTEQICANFSTKPYCSSAYLESRREYLVKARKEEERRIRR